MTKLHINDVYSIDLLNTYIYSFLKELSMCQSMDIIISNIDDTVKTIQNNLNIHVCNDIMVSVKNITGFDNFTEEETERLIFEYVLTTIKMVIQNIIIQQVEFNSMNSLILQYVGNYSNVFVN